MVMVKAKAASTVRRFGVMLALTSLMLVAFGPTALANHTIEIRNYDETAHECSGPGFKIEAQHLAEGEHRYEIYNTSDALVFAVTLDIALNSAGELAELVSWSDADPSVSVVYIVAGGEATIWPLHPLKTQGEHAGEPREISHISFCLGPSATPTPTPTATGTLPDSAVGPGSPLSPAGGSRDMAFLLLVAGTLLASWLVLRPARRRA